MAYDSSKKYAVDDFRELSPTELHTLFEEAHIVVLEVRGRKLIKKVTKDISSMRRLLNGFDSIYNGNT